MLTPNIIKFPRTQIPHTLDWRATEDLLRDYLKHMGVLVRHSIGAGCDFAAYMREALIAAESGCNVFTETRTVIPGLPGERGKEHATAGVHSFVADIDNDRGRGGNLPIAASMRIETSPGNFQDWYFYSRALSVAGAKIVGKFVRDNYSIDKCSGVVTQCVRIPGLPNIPDAKKAARGRIVVPTRIVLHNGRQRDPHELMEAFTDKQAAFVNAAKPITPGSYARHLIAIPAAQLDDRSEHFHKCVCNAIRAGMSIDEIEALMRRHPQGCAEKYLDGGDRLRQEIIRSATKASQQPNGVRVCTDGLAELLGEPAKYIELPEHREPMQEHREPAAQSVDPLAWHKRLLLDPRLSFGALRLAGWILHHCQASQSSSVKLTLSKTAKTLSISEQTIITGRDFLVNRKWLARDGNTYQLMKGSKN
jgi:hypothetical protein